MFEISIEGAFLVETKLKFLLSLSFVLCNLNIYLSERARIYCVSFIKSLETGLEETRPLSGLRIFDK